MLAFEKITISGFLSVPETDLLEVRLDEVGLNLVLGRNGAGKSTRYTEALVWGLYGEMLRELKSADGVINKDSNSARVNVEMTDLDTGDIYNVFRAKDRGRSEVVQVTRKTIIPSTGAIITSAMFPAANAAELQEKIDEWMGMDFRTFTNSVIFGQQATALFAAGLSDSERKAVFDRLCGFDVYDKAYVVAKEKETAAGRASADAQTKFLQAQSLLTMARQNQKQFTDGLENLRAEIVRERAELTKNMEKLVQDKIAIATRVHDITLKIQALGLKEAALPPVTGDPAVLAELADAKTYLRQLEGLRTDLEIEQAKLVTRLDRATTERHRLEESYRTAKCTYCGGPLADLNKVGKDLDKVRESFSLDAGQHFKGTESLSAVNADIIDVKTLIDGHEQTLRDAGAESRELAKELDAQQDILSGARTIHQMHENAQIAQMRALEALDRREAALEASATSLAAVVDKHVGELEVAQTLRDSLYAEEEILSFWTEAFGPKGIKAFLIENLLPHLNERIAEHLGYLTDGTITARVSATTALKKGGTAERLSVEVINSEGAELYGGNSGGERRRIDLAILLALQDLVGMRANRSVNLAVYDEILDALDEDGTTKAIAYLKIRSLTRPTYLISHSPSTKTLVEDVIHV